MNIEILTAAVNADADRLPDRMNLFSDAVICNQCGEYGYREFGRGEHRVRVFSLADRGVGLNRNTALLHAQGDLVLFADEDIVYDDGCGEKILAAFAEHPDADMLLFNVEAAPGRKTYENTDFHRIRWNNYGRYPTYSVCARRDALRRANVSFSLLFGGGTKYGSGEDSLFLHDCLRARLRIFAVPVRIGHEEPREEGRSTWFSGYNEKYFHDKGVLYHFLYGAAARPFALAILLRHRKKLCAALSLKEAYACTVRGIREGKRA